MKFDFFFNFVENLKMVTLDFFQIIINIYFLFFPFYLVLLESSSF